MDRQQNRPTLHRRLERIGAILWNSCRAESRCNAARHVTGRFAESGRQRSCGDDWPNSGKHQRDRGEKMPGQLAETSRGSRVLDFRAGRSANILCITRLFVVIPTDDREVIGGHADAVSKEGSQDARS